MVRHVKTPYDAMTPEELDALTDAEIDAIEEHLLLIEIDRRQRDPSNVAMDGEEVLRDLGF